MKILLIRPPVPKFTIGLKNIMICEPLELEYVAAGLDGHDVQIMDLILEKNLNQRLQSFDPDIIGTSSYIAGVNEVIKICREVKTWKKECWTVVGGVQAAQVAEDFIDNSVDIIVKGDGTTLMSQIVDSINENNDIFGIPGLAFPKSEGELFETPESHYMIKPDELPFPRRDLVGHLKDQYYYLMHRPVATMKTSWGCWYHCNFCYTWRITNGIAYARGAESIVDELETIEASEVYIVDDIFLIKPSRLNKIAQLIRERGINKNYLVYARADFIANNPLIIKEWAEIGLRAVFVGLDAVTEAELDDMNKESDLEDNQKAIDVLFQNGVDVYGSLIPNPDYTLEDWKRLRKFIYDSGLYYLNISPLVPLPGTVEYEKYKDRLSVPRKAHGLWDLSHAVIKTKLPLSQYYWQLLKTYAIVFYNFPRARRVTKRTLPSIWSLNYFKLILGSTKIAWQFINAHRHHSRRNLARAMDKGESVDLEFSYHRLREVKDPKQVTDELNHEYATS